MILPEKLKDRSLFVANAQQAGLAKRSVYSLSYTDTAQHAVGLSLPIADKVFQDGDLFAALDMNCAVAGVAVRHHAPAVPSAVRRLMTQAWEEGGLS